MPPDPAPPPPQGPDLASLRAAKGGDHRAFDEIMRVTERRVARLAWRVLGERGEVEEAVQETFLRLYRHLGRYQEGRSFQAWLFRITINVCRDLERRRWRRRLFSAPLAEAALLPSDATGADEELIRRAELARLGAAIDALPRQQRLAIILRDVEELPTEQVAEILGSSPSTVRVHIARARVKLRQRFAAAAPEEVTS